MLFRNSSVTKNTIFEVKQTFSIQSSRKFLQMINCKYGRVIDVKLYKYTSLFMNIVMISLRILCKKISALIRIHGRSLN